jgi:hypothetical protein
VIGRTTCLVLVVALATTACVSVPTGPNVVVLPGSGKPLEDFQADDASCRQWAAERTGTTTKDAAAESGVTSALIGTAVGAALGAAVGAVAGNPGIGAAVGAGAGLLGGTAAGVGTAEAAHRTVQQRYDASYMQCMYAKGNQIPVRRGSHSAYSGQAPGHIPPPPPGSPPPPPPGSAR